MKVKHEEELSLLKEAGITIHQLRDIIGEMEKESTVVKAASGADLFDLIRLKS